MHSSPYRVSSPPPAALEPEGTENHIAEFIPAYAIVWLLSMVRVGGCLLRHDTFGAEPTLAMFAIVLLAYLLRDAFRGSWRIKDL